MRALRMLSPIPLVAVTLSGCSSSTAEAEIVEDPATFANATAADLSGTFFYVTSGMDGGESAVWSFQDGQEPQQLVTAPTDLMSSANVSPDGRYLSWATVELETGESRLRVHDIAEDTELDLDVTGIDAYCHEPVWTAEGQLYTRPEGMVSGEAARLYDVESGESTEVDLQDGCHVRFPPHSEGAETYGYQHGDVSGLAFQNGEDTVEVPAEAVPDKMIAGMTTVARDNAAACVLTLDPGVPPGDVARKLTCDTILDLEDNTPVEIPGDDTDVGLFPETGGFITRGAEGGGNLLRLSDMEEQDIATVEEPAELSAGFPIAYIP